MSPLDKPVAPSQAEQARYQRALTIAQQPAIIMDHIKKGTLQMSDIHDLGAMYPGLYKAMAAKLSDAMVNSQNDETHIPYKTRMSMSLFLGQPLDSSMTSQHIQASQAIYAPKAPQGPQPQGKTKKGTTALGKHNKSYMTPSQAAESDRGDRD
jgi:hypothetical protein